MTEPFSAEHRTFFSLLYIGFFKMAILDTLRLAYVSSPKSSLKTDLNYESKMKLWSNFRQEQTLKTQLLYCFCQLDLGYPFDQLKLGCYLGFSFYSFLYDCYVFGSVWFGKNGKTPFRSVTNGGCPMYPPISYVPISRSVKEKRRQPRKEKKRPLLSMYYYIVCNVLQTRADGLYQSLLYVSFTYEQGRVL